MMPASIQRETTIVKVVGPSGGSMKVRITDPSTGDVWDSEYFNDNISAWEFNKKVRHWFN